MPEKHTATASAQNGQRDDRSGIVAGVGIVHLLDHLPETVAETPGTAWSVLARSLGEQGADGRTALAWRWALTGTCPSPITLSRTPGTPPSRHELRTEAHAEAELADADPGGQVMHARFVLQWLPGDLPALPLWNGGPNNRHVTDGAAVPRSATEVDNVCSWALLAQWRNPAAAGSASADILRAQGIAHGTAQLLDWARGISPESPLTRMRVPERPSLYQLSLDAMHAMASLKQARQDKAFAVAGRMEAIIETYAWLAGWEPSPPVDRHGHRATEDCPEREVPCRCDSLFACIRTECPACWRMPCVHGFSQDLAP